MKNLVIVGAGGLGRELLQIVKVINAKKPTWNVIGFVDDNVNALDGIECDIEIIGTVQEWIPSHEDYVAIGIADTHTKKKIVEMFNTKGAQYANIVHPDANIGSYNKMGQGIVICSHADITVNCKIGNFVFMNSYAAVGHDAVIGDYCTLFPYCNVAGYTILGEGVTIGALASTYPGIKIGDYATVGMNSAVIRNVKSASTVMGVPAKTIY